MQHPRCFSFVGGVHGAWRVTCQTTRLGEPLESIQRLDIQQANRQNLPPEAVWILRGVTSNLRYTTESERQQLTAVQEGLGRPQATRAALLPIKKTAQWWELPQDERRRIFEERSNHTTIGLKYLPAIARRLHHGYDLNEPFDFVTWFEFAPRDETAFDELLDELRQSEEWMYVEREVDIRLQRTDT